MASRSICSRSSRCRWQALLLAAALLTNGGCRYLDARARDFGDCFLYRFHQDALGVAAVAKLGPAELAVGGWYAEYGIGKDAWWQVPGYTLTNHGTGVPFTTLGPLGYGQSWSRLLSTSTGGNHPEDPSAFDDVRSWLLISDVFDLDDGQPFQLSTARRISDLFGVEVGVAPVFWNVHVGFNVAEFADCLLGIVLIDVFGDDGFKRPPTVPVLPASDARQPRRFALNRATTRGVGDRGGANLMRRRGVASRSAAKYSPVFDEGRPRRATHIHHDATGSSCRAVASMRRSKRTPAD